MSHVLFEKEVKQLIKLGVPQNLAVLTACSSRMDDEYYKNLFHNTLNRTKEENNMVGEELRKSGMRPVLSTDTIDEPDSPATTHDDTTNDDKK